MIINKGLRQFPNAIKSWSTIRLIGASKLAVDTGLKCCMNSLKTMNVVGSVKCFRLSVRLEYQYHFPACFVEGQRLPNCSTAGLSTIDSPCIAIENVYLMSEEGESLDCFMIFFFNVVLRKIDP